jgi:microcystin-dependent protein
LPGTTWTTWGSGRVPVGVDTSQTEFNTVEKTGGAKTHTLTVNEMPSHKHSVADSGHSHSFSAPKDQTDIPNGAHHKGVRDYGDFTTESAKANITESTVGSDYAHNNLQPYITCYMFKRIV